MDGEAKSSSADATDLLDNSEIPENVTPEFYTKLKNLQRRFGLDAPAPKDLRLLAYEIRNDEDANQFKAAFAQWRKHAADLPHSDADNLVFFHNLMKARCYTAVLDLACQRGTYAFFLNHDQIHSLMAGFRSEIISPDSSDEQRLMALDNMSKAFLLLLFSGIAPNAKTYALLLTSGVYSGLDEGWRRSVVTAKEQISLGIPLDKDAAVAEAQGGC